MQDGAINVPGSDHSGATQFKKPADRIRRGGYAAPSLHCQQGPVISNESGIPSQGLRLAKAGKGGSALSRPGRAKKQQARLANDNRGGVHGFACW